MQAEEHHDGGGLPRGGECGRKRVGVVALDRVAARDVAHAVLGVRAHRSAELAEDGRAPLTLAVGRRLG